MFGFKSRKQKEAERLAKEKELQETEAKRLAKEAKIEERINNSESLQKANEQLQQSAQETLNGSLALAQENHRLSVEMKEMVERHQQKEANLNAREKRIKDDEEKTRKYLMSAEEKYAQARQMEILLQGRDSELKRNEQLVQKKDKELDKERKDIKEREKDAQETKEKYDALKAKLDAKKSETERLNQEAKENAKAAAKERSEADSIFAKAKTAAEDMAAKEEALRKGYEEKSDALNEKIAEYDRKIAEMDQIKEQFEDISFDDTEDGRKAKIVVKETIRQGMKAAEGLMDSFKELDEKYCSGTFKGFAVPLSEIDDDLSDLKVQYQQVVNHAEASGIQALVAKLIDSIEQSIVNATNSKDKWDFAECYRNIQQGLTTCKNYEILVQILCSGDTGSEEEAGTPDDFEEFVDYYEILEVDEDASEKEIQRAYKKQAKKWHPDKFASASEEDRLAAEEKMRQINKAKEVLLDETKRQEFNQRRNMHNAA